MNTMDTMTRPALRLAQTRAAPDRVSTDGLIAESHQMLDLLAEVQTLSELDVAVLVCGETGVGKELIAASLHRHSARRRGPFVPLNCAALSDGVLESELFGHSRGAFTGADRHRVGAIEAASGGTLFLDEVGELSAKAQASLLRVLQERVIRRVGETHTRPSDFRLVAATHRDLRRGVDDGSFREDLFFRLSTFELRVPALRERPPDLHALTRHFLRRHSKRFGWCVPKLSDGCITHLEAHRWPGNVRELEGAVLRALVKSKQAAVLLPEHFQLPRDQYDTPSSLVEASTAFERTYLIRSLGHYRGNRSQTARALGISRQGLYLKLRRHGLLAR